ncbi:DUF1926 domain-containing protein [bacterium]|nr:DUF1926 domain-containing protein [bacterium]
MKKINFAFGLHNHQPVGNFDHVFKDAYHRAYLPFLELLENHPNIRIAQHYTGILFEWIKEHKPEFIPRLKSLVDAGQVEMMTGGFYEPILSVIPDRDKIGQIDKLTDFVRENTGYDPAGMWLAERIWEPHLPKPIAQAGLQYVVLDDSHFKSAGLTEAELHGYYLTEEEGATVSLFPISEMLRYTIPFQPPEKTIEYLKTLATEDGQTLVVFADDGEKFGIWPETYKHCYEDGWLAAFFQALEENSHWIRIVHFAEALKEIRPLGRVYLPTTSYREMMEWAMPKRAIHEYEQFESILKERELYERYKVFVRGGFWRNFMAKYPEVNNMHKKMLQVSRRLADFESEHGKSTALQAVRDHLWAGQCNCPYWHGVFGGLYLNHLRYATYRHLIQAEGLLEELEGKEDGYVEYELLDYDGDGMEELLLRNGFVNLYFAPNAGGSLFELDFKPSAINLLDTLTRREESYHRKLIEAAGLGTQAETSEVLSIHDLVVEKEAGLAERLHYDWYRRSALVDHFLASETTLDEFASSSYTEVGDFVNKPFESRLERTESGLTANLWRTGTVRFPGAEGQVRLQKTVFLTGVNSEIAIDYEITNLDEEDREFWFGSEFHFALLAGDAPDRYYLFPDRALTDARLCSSGDEQEAGEVQLIDEWLALKVSLHLEQAASIWRFPIETVSQSEAGFERVYQSSGLLPNWKFRLAPEESWRTRITLRLDVLD